VQGWFKTSIINPAGSPKNEFMDCMNKKFEKIKLWLDETYKKIDHFSGGVLSIFNRALTRFTDQRGSEAAASMAYYAFFSIFPMLLVFIVVGSFFVDGWVRNNDRVRKEDIRKEVADCEMMLAVFMYSLTGSTPDNALLDKMKAKLGDKANLLEN